ncbi:ATP-dependent DNA helicase [Mesobacillus foraminis]|uniref:ATP-dependent DNA helicase DinG n=1 Tax=Mesobacillus foraminis TaxID=279826 RepID=A0A4R2BA26_9BACI|nr:ATP-dependent DNA helicase [Mesobacillus foraminis]TCN23095.1 ATP-dependent DNA helicase DinG [Mesobacillus foraminis]
MPGTLPFTISKTDSFFEKLSEWIGDVFYEILPEAGFEERDEQIFMAFQLEKAFKDKKAMFAEAGVGTGKTIVYLLYAVCYARYTNQPAIIACADERLIEQLVKKEGDIAKLEQALQLNMDVRLAKSRDQYLCLNKLDPLVTDDDEAYNAVYDSLPAFVNSTSTLQKFHRYGDRTEYPSLTDEQWANISWDPLQDCLACSRRHRCGLTLQREHYRNAADIIVCSHDFYMEHIWTKESRIREGELPFLPDGSCVVFDEGHLLEFASQKALTYRFAERTLETLLTRIMDNDVREKTLDLMEQAISKNDEFFAELAKCSSESRASEKMTVHKAPSVTALAENLLWLLDSIQEELVFESEMFVIDDYNLKIVEEYLDQISYSLSLFARRSIGINWLENHNGEKTLVIMPKMVEEILRKEVFSQQKPFIFSSATLSEGNSFDYLAKSLGIDDYLSFSVSSPFDYEEKMRLYLPEFSPVDFEARAKYAMDQIQSSNGRALVLFTDMNDLHSFKKYVQGSFGFPLLFEGDAEISTLVSRFQNEEQSVLCSVNLWEGLDIPGRALENVILFTLPFPPNDPVFAAKREEASNSFTEVDLPYMLLRLRQGIGRLIRTSTDQGEVHVLLDQNLEPEVLERIHSVLPVHPSKLNNGAKLA